MGKTFIQLADEAMAQARAVSAEEAVQELNADPNTLLLDVRDKDEVMATGLGIGAINAPGTSIAWKACLEISEEYATLKEKFSSVTTLDELTGCYNEVHFKEVLMQHRAMSEREPLVRPAYN